MTRSTLTKKQQRFVSEYLVNLNATQAAFRAGYSKRTAKQQGARLLTNVDVQKAVEEGQKAIGERNELSQDMVVQELRLLGFSNMADYMTVTKDGSLTADFTKLTREQAAAIHEVTVDEFTDGKGKDARPVRRVKFKLADKRAALVDLGRHLGIFRDRVELTDKGGKPIPVANVDYSDMPAEEAARRYKAFIESVN